MTHNTNNKDFSENKEITWKLKNVAQLHFINRRSAVVSEMYLYIYLFISVLGSKITGLGDEEASI